MKPKTARRRLRTYAWKAARLGMFSSKPSIFATARFARLWRYWTKEALKED